MVASAPRKASASSSTTAVRTLFPVFREAVICARGKGEASHAAHQPAAWKLARFLKLGQMAGDVAPRTTTSRTEACDSWRLDQVSPSKVSSCCSRFVVSCENSTYDCSRDAEAMIAPPRPIAPLGRLAGYEEPLSSRLQVAAFLMRSSSPLAGKMESCFSSSFSFVRKRKT